MTIDYVYDTIGNVTEVKRNGETVLEYAYNGNMQVVREEDHVNDSVIFDLTQKEAPQAVAFVLR